MPALPSARQLSRLFLISWFFAQASFALESGSPVPNIELKTANGQIRLDQLRGKVVYVDFWASWCAPCRRSFPWMNDIQSKYAAQGLQVIGINLDANSDDARRFLAATPARFEVAFDPEGGAARRFEVKGMPTSVLIGRDGKVLSQHVGFNDEARDKLEAAMRSALQGQ